MEEQATIKNEFNKIIYENDENSDEEHWGGIFKKREKSDNTNDTEEQYAKWLAGESSANVGENSETLKPLKEYWSNPKMSKEEQFLRDYILTNGYAKTDANKVPTYSEVVDSNEVISDLSADEAELEKQAQFEHKFNFRFEEPDSEFIQRYPRTIENSVRRSDNKRAEKRSELKERKQKEKQQKMKELEMLSAMKKREIEEKIDKLKQVAGAEALLFDNDDLNTDFDPEEYDQKMSAMFNNEYYQIDEGEAKPECPDIDDLMVEDWDNYDPKDDKEDANNDDEPYCEDNEFNMDCDYLEEDSHEQAKKSFQNEIIDSTRGRRKRRKRQSKFAQIIKQGKPIFDEHDFETYGQYLDEYYKLDYEDIIGDVPCRFKYTETVPNDFGLTVEEVNNWLRYCLYFIMK